MAYGMYKGKEVCQGCKKPGSDVPRRNKEDLCNNCAEKLKLGLSVTHESSIEYAYVFQHYYAFHGEFLNKMIHEILEALHNPFAEVPGGIEYIKWTTGSNGKRYKIDKRVLQPLKTLFIDLEKRIEDLSKQEERIPSLVRLETQKVKNEIYKEGIEKGKQLLLQLNAGDISINDFNNQHHNYKG